MFVLEDLFVLAESQTSSADSSPWPNVALFILGSDGAHNVPILIAGHIIQGVRAGSVYLLIDAAYYGLVLLRERSK